ncbi:methylated-DNA--[protein]-cysteine S-methyltransferase [bacterium]|nr:methylated-DNA--[protein]-cysteine S-methyltransferase [bacterium]MCB2202351.1 methylated-DNA--[protein]-cysteine S-methyltransferase [bacterium]
MQLFLHSFDSPLGRFATLSTAGELIRVLLPGLSVGEVRAHFEAGNPGSELVEGGVINRRAEHQITEYLAGKLKLFDLPFRIDAPPFCVRALTEVSRIPYGRTATYGEIARALGSPGSARAVGTANAKNPLPIVIPCHRVVASSGLGGYGGGLAMKKTLLNIEGRSLV